MTQDTKEDLQNLKLTAFRAKYKNDMKRRISWSWSCPWTSHQATNIITHNLDFNCQHSVSYLCHSLGIACISFKHNSSSLLIVFKLCIYIPHLIILCFLYLWTTHHTHPYIQDKSSKLYSSQPEIKYTVWTKNTHVDPL